MNKDLIQPSFAGGSMVPAPGTPEYAASFNLAADARRPVPGSSPTDPTGSTPGMDRSGRSWRGADGGFYTYDSTGNIVQGKPDQNAIQGDMLDQVQGSVDAIRNTYAGIIASETQRAEGAAGRTRALAARSGTLGSDFGNAAIDKTGRENENVMNTLLAKRDAEIESLIIGAKTRATQRYDKLYQDATVAQDKRLTQEKTHLEDSKKEIAMLGQYGMTIDKLTPEEIDAYTKQTGYNKDELAAALAINRKPGSVVQQWAEGDKYNVITRDPITGAYNTDSIKLPFALPTKMTAHNIGNNTIAFYPEKFDPSKPVKDQVTYYSIGSTGGSGTGSYGEKADAIDAKNWLYRNSPDKDKDLAAFESDPSFREYVLGQARYEKSTGKKGAGYTP